jgi:tetratricopeptide (TPR) repeat protein
MSQHETPAWSLSIDFGTSFTTAAMTRPGDPAGEPMLVEVENSRYLPSIVVRDESGELLTGRNAVRQAVVFPERAARVPKRALVAGGDAVLGGTPVPVTDLVATLLRKMFAEAVRSHGGQPPRQVVLTHPARWGEALRGRLREAAGKAGIAEPALLAEPVAAAWCYARPASGTLVAVFDLGGGTLDTAVLRARDAGYEVAGPPGGDASLGGEDFDDLLLGRVSDLARSRDTAEWAELFEGRTSRSHRELAQLRADVTTAKEALSEFATYDLAVAGFAEAFRVARNELEELIEAAVDGAAAEMLRTVAAAGISPDKLAGLFLTGGSSRIPLIAVRLAEKLGVQPRLGNDPKAVVALGALIAASSANAAAAAQALYDEGDRFRAQGRSDDAVVAYRRAVETKDPVVAPGAAIDLGSMLRERGDIAGAKAAYQLSIDSGNPSQVARALFNLSRILYEQGDVRAAVTALRQAADSDDFEAAPMAGVNLGVALQELGDRRGAIAAFRRVVESGNHEYEPLAANYLGVLLMMQGDTQGARAAYQRAIDSGHQEAAPQAEVGLAYMLLQGNDIDGALPLLQSAVQSGNQEAAEMAAEYLAEMERQGLIYRN